MAMPDSKFLIATPKSTLAAISERIAEAAKITVIVGAGISTGAGIPDFTSGGGKEFRQNLSANMLKDSESKAILTKKLAKLIDQASNSTPTEAHQLLKRLVMMGKIARIYSQNIDGLEEAVGISCGPPSFPKQSLEDVECLTLHGSVNYLYCGICKTERPTGTHVTAMHDGILPQCTACVETEEGRAQLEKRPHSIGELRPSITLYDDYFCPHDEDIGKVLAMDLGKAETDPPDLMIIAGTKLHIKPIREFVTQYSKAMRLRHGNFGKSNEPKIIFVNLTPPSNPGKLSDVFDLWVQMDVQEFAKSISVALDRKEKDLADALLSPLTSMDSFSDEMKARLEQMVLDTEGLWEELRLSLLNSKAAGKAHIQDFSRYWAKDLPKAILDIFWADKARIKQGKLYRIPSSLTVRDILEEYEEHIKAERPSQKDHDVIEVVLDGFLVYFDHFFDLRLLCDHEREQYEAFCEDGPASELYGAEYLVRHLYELQHILPFTGLDYQSLLIIEHYAQNLARFLESNTDRYFVKK